MFALVGRELAAFGSQTTTSDTLKKEIAKNIALVGEGVKTLSYATLSREVEAWEDKIYNLESILNVTENNDTFVSEAEKKKDMMIKMRINSLTLKVGEAKNCIKYL